MGLLCKWQLILPHNCSQNFSQDPILIPSYIWFLEKIEPLQYYGTLAIISAMKGSSRYKFYQEMDLSISTKVDEAIVLTP